MNVTPKEPSVPIYNPNEICCIPFDLNGHLRSIETRFIEDYLTASDGNKTVAAKLLGISRTALISRLYSLKLNHWIRNKRELKN